MHICDIGYRGEGRTENGEEAAWASLRGVASTAAVADDRTNIGQAGTDATSEDALLEPHVG